MQKGVKIRLMLHIKMLDSLPTVIWLCANVLVEPELITQMNVYHQSIYKLSATQKQEYTSDGASTLRITIISTKGFS